MFLDKRVILVDRRATGLDNRAICLDRGAMLVMLVVRRGKVSRCKKAMLIALRNDKIQCDRGVSSVKFEREGFCRAAVGGILWHGSNRCDGYELTECRYWLFQV